MYKIDKSLVDNMNFNKSFIIINREDQKNHKEVYEEKREEVREPVPPAIKIKEHCILKGARNTAEGIISEAQKEAEKIKECARQQGYEKGMQDATEELEILTERQTQEVSSIVKKLERCQQEIDSKMQDSILQLSIDVAEKIINIQIERDDTLYIGIVKKAIAGLKSAEKFILRVSRAEYEKYFKEGSKRLLDEMECVTFEVICDPFAEEKSCIVDSDEGIINAGVSAQLDKIQRSLKERANIYG